MADNGPDVLIPPSANPSNIAGEITRILSARNLIRTKFVDLGISNGNDDITALATAASNIENRGNVTATVQEGSTYTIPKGYHNGSGTVSGVAGGGNYNLQSKSDITPTKNQINVTPDDGYYGLSDVTINPIPDAYQDVSSVTATASDVLATKIFVPSSGSNTTGTMPNNGAVSKTLDATTGNQSYTVPRGYHNGSGTVSITLENQTVTPTTSSQNVTPTTGKVLGKVTVNAIPSKFGDTTGDDAVASNILSGKKAHTISGGSAVQITGSMTNNGAVNQTLTTSSTQYTVPAGYHNGSGKVSIVTETKTATPSSSSQTINATSGKVLSSVVINAIPSPFYDTSAVDAAASNVLVGKTIVDATGAQVSGTMSEYSVDAGTEIAKLLDISTTSYNIPQGYHDGNGNVYIFTETKTATPARSSQTVSPSAGCVLSQVTVDAIPSKYGDTTGDDAVAANLLSGKKAHSISNGTAVQITGSMTNRGAVTSTLTTTSTEYTIQAGYHNGSGKVSIVTETKSVTPSSAAQTVYATSGKVISAVTVNSIPSPYFDTSSVDATASNVLSGKKIVSSTGAVVTGTMTNRGAVSQTLTTSSTQYTVPAGYHSGTGKVSIVLEEKSATPTESVQNITPTSGKVLSKVTVNAISSTYVGSGVPTKTSANLTVSGATVTAPSGYYATAASTSVNTTTLGAITSSISNNKLVASLTQTAGYVTAGSTSTNIADASSQSAAVVPTTSSQVVLAKGVYANSTFYVAAIPSKYGDVTSDTAVASNILAGVKAHTISNGSAVQVTGTMANKGTISQSFDGMTVSSYTLSAGYYAGGIVYLDNSIETALSSI